MRLAPAALSGYSNTANYDLALQRFDEARQMIRDAQARKLHDQFFTRLSMLSPFSEPTLRHWRSSSNFSRAGLKKTGDSRCIR